MACDAADLGNAMPPCTTRAGVYREARVANLDYDVLPHMVPLNVTDSLYCYPEADPRTWTHHCDAPA